jgi:RHS repeat-associated protein
MAYDAEGHMNPTSGTTYTYDGDGRRVKKSDGTLYWMDDAFRTLATGTTTGSISRDFLFVGKKRIAFVPLSTGNPYYYLSDHLGSTAVIASGDGKTVQWEADYFPFGAERQIFTNLASNSYQFTGYEYDSDTQYNYALARFEAGRWGRFLTSDPYLGSADIGNPQSLNRYSYVMNNTTDLIDPSGLYISGTPGVPGIGMLGDDLTGPYRLLGLDGEPIPGEINVADGPRGGGRTSASIPNPDHTFNCLPTGVQGPPAPGCAGASVSDPAGAAGSAQYGLYLGQRLLHQLACLPGTGLEVGGNELRGLIDEVEVWDPTPFSSTAGKYVKRLNSATGSSTKELAAPHHSRGMPHLAK